MQIDFTSHAWEEYERWEKTDPNVVKKIKKLLAAIQVAPFHGPGKPEPLKYDLKGYWSRRITGEHRLVYRIIGKKAGDQKCLVVQCRFHY